MLEWQPSNTSCCAATAVCLQLSHCNIMNDAATTVEQCNTTWLVSNKDLQYHCSAVCINMACSHGLIVIYLTCDSLHRQAWEHFDMIYKPIVQYCGYVYILGAYYVKTTTCPQLQLALGETE